MLALASMATALLIGFLLVQVFDPVRSLQPRWAAILFRVGLGAGSGIALASVVFLFLDAGGLAAPTVIFGIDAILIGILTWTWLRRRTAAMTGPPTAVPDAPPCFRWTWLLAIAFGIALAAAGARLIQMAMALPVGGWDAWAIWNLRAKFLAGPPGAWRYAVSPLLNRTHPDYPLLLSAFIARGWKAGGTLDTLVPIATGLLFFAAVIALLLSAVALLRGAASGFAAGLVLLSTTSLLIWAPAQYSDIPLALYYLGAISLLFVAAVPSTNMRLALTWAGVFAGFAAWTKNEGIAFLICTLLALFVFSLWQRGASMALSRTACLLAGAAPGVLLTIWLKFFLAPAVDPLVTQGASGLARLTDFSRYGQVAGAFLSNLFNLGSGVSHPVTLLAILAILLRWQKEERYILPSLIGGAALVLVFLSYCFVYLITPSGAAWQAQTSFDRLILQLWPSVLLVFFVQLRSIADAAVPEEAPKISGSRKAPARSATTPGAKAAAAGKKVK